MNVLEVCGYRVQINAKKYFFPQQNFRQISRFLSRFWGYVDAFEYWVGIPRGKLREKYGFHPSYTVHTQKEDAFRAFFVYG